jgi:xanthine dehydrogenase accessory factor
MILREDGQVQGSISGGCIEADLIEQLSSGESWDRAPFLLKYGVTQDETRRYAIPCGGTMELLIEPTPDITLMDELARRIAQGELVRRTVVVGRPCSEVITATAADAFQWDGHTLSTIHGPLWRLLIIGAGQTSTYLAQMAQALDYQITVCDPRSEYTAGWDVAQTRLIHNMPDDAVIELNPDPRSAVVALTHDPKLDDLALLIALKSPAFYIGALGSRSNSRRRRERFLQHFDLSVSDVERLHGPVGLSIGSRTPPEIAVAILAEMTAVRNGAWQAGQLLPRGQSSHSECAVA